MDSKYEAHIPYSTQLCHGLNNQPFWLDSTIKIYFFAGHPGHFFYYLKPEQQKINQIWPNIHCEKKLVTGGVTECMQEVVHACSV